MPTPPRSTPYQYAIYLLSKRDYSFAELRQKMQLKGYDVEDIDSTLQRLQEAHYIDDERFIENFIRAGVNKGYGSLRIQQDLRQKGIIAAEQINLLFAEIDWQTHAAQCRHKRFGAEKPKTPQEKAKQVRFLQARGFTSSQCFAALNISADENTDYPDDFAED